MVPDEAELADRLRAGDHALPFDATRFANRVLAERLRRRRNLRQRSAAAVAVVLTWWFVWAKSPSSPKQAAPAPSDAVTHADSRVSSPLEIELAARTRMRQQEELARLVGRAAQAHSQLKQLQEARSQEQVMLYRADRGHDIKTADVLDLVANGS